MHLTFTQTDSVIMAESVSVVEFMFKPNTKRAEGKNPEHMESCNKSHNDIA